MDRGVGKSVTLATTVTRITAPSSPQCKVLTLFRATTSTIIYVVTDGTADGAALPSTGRMAIDAADLPLDIDISPYGSIGLAGDAIGSVESMLS